MSGYRLKRSRSGEVHDDESRVVRFDSYAQACRWIAEQWDKRTGGKAAKRRAKREREPDDRTAA